MQVNGYAGEKGRTLFLSAHLPEHTRVLASAVLCAPLLREGVSAQATFRLLAEKLTDSGLAAIRFDYVGCGDSEGDLDHLDGIGEMLGSIAEAAAVARATVDGPVIGIGMRAGALLLAQVAEALGLDGVVLWDPCVAGGRFLREQRVMSVVQHEAQPPRGDGAVEVPGFVLPARLASELGSLDLAGCALGGLASAGSLAVLTRQPQQRSAVERAIGEEAARSTLWAEAGGQEELLERQPLHHAIPVRAVGEVTALAVAIARRRASGDRPPELRSPPLRARLTVRGTDGGSVTEEPLSLGPRGLFGIDSRPQSGARAGSPVVLFLNSGNDSHIGPNRLWVQLARRWAEAGLRSVRFDVAGLGESPDQLDGTRQVVRSVSAFDDVRDVAEALAPGHPGDVVLVGLCSGAYQGLESGLELRPAGVLAVNPIFRFVPPEAALGRVDPRRHFIQGGSLFRKARRLPGPLLRLARMGGDRLLGTLSPSSPAAAIRRLGALGVPCLCIGGPSELAPVTGGLTAGERVHGSVRLHVVDGLDHALLRASERAEIADLLSFELFTWLSPSCGGEPVGQAEVAPTSLVG